MRDSCASLFVLVDRLVDPITEAGHARIHAWRVGLCASCGPRHEANDDSFTRHLSKKRRTGVPNAGVYPPRLFTSTNHRGINLLSDAAVMHGVPTHHVADDGDSCLSQYSRHDKFCRSKFALRTPASNGEIFAWGL